MQGSQPLKLKSSKSKALLELQPEAVGGPVSTPPEPEDIIKQIADRTLVVHPSKATTLSARRMQMQICNIQRHLRLQAGAAGQWSTQAHEKLTQWLLKSEQKRARGETLSPHTNSMLMPLEYKPCIQALEDAQPEGVPQGSGANGPEQGTEQDIGEMDSDDDHEHPQPAGSAKGRAKSPSSSTSSSSSSSTSSAAKRLHHARSAVAEASEALDNLAPLFISACKPCKDNVANLQNLLRKALHAMK